MNISLPFGVIQVGPAGMRRTAARLTVERRAVAFQEAVWINSAGLAVLVGLPVELLPRRTQTIE
jgi:hypothetical protein